MSYVVQVYTDNWCKVRKLFWKYFFLLTAKNLRICNGLLAWIMSLVFLQDMDKFFALFAELSYLKPFGAVNLCFFSLC